MSESPSAPAPISADHMARIEQDARRGIGASSGDTLRLVGELSRFIRDPLTIESQWVDAMFNIVEDQNSTYDKLEVAHASLRETVLCSAHELGLPVDAGAQQVVAAIHALQVNNAKLRKLLAEKVVTSTMLTGLVPDDGGMTLGFEGGACGMLAQLFGDQFYESKAINYLELRFDSAKHPELGPLVVTLQRVEGKTPHQLREQAEKAQQAATEAYQTACQVRNRLIDQVATLQADPNSWQSGYDEGRRMGTKTMLETRALDARLAGFWRSPKDMPPEGVPLVVLRDAGAVGNDLHAGHRTGRWLELTAADGAMFLCDMISTGNVIGWVGADEFQGLEAMSLAADRYQWLRKDDVAQCQISTKCSEEKMDAAIDAAMGKEGGEEFRCKTCYFQWVGTKDHPDSGCATPDVRAGWRP